MIAEKSIEAFRFDFSHRHYDPTIGRWATKDPIGFAGGDTNLYAYVGGDPMSYIDPSGLAQECSYPIDGAGGVEHPQMFFEDKAGGDLGFYPDVGSPMWTNGVFEQSGKSFEDLKKSGKCEDKHYDDAVMRQAFSDVSKQNMRYTLIPYIAGNNCKTMMNIVIDRYNYLMHQRNKK
jgi:RHS repeat-associated protein